jgi:integrase
MSSVWIRVRVTTSGAKRYRVEYRAGGREAAFRYGGSFRTQREAKIRRDLIAVELAALRVPDLNALTAATAQTATFATAASDWLASRIDVSAGTQVQNRTSVGRAVQVIGKRRIDQLGPRDIADLVTQLHREGVAPGYLRKVLQAVAMTLDHAGVTPNPARDRTVVRMPYVEPEQVNPPTADHVIRVYRLLATKHRLPLLFLDWSGARVSVIDHTLVGDYDDLRQRVRLRAATAKTRRALWVELPPALADAVEQSIGPREDRDPDARLFAQSGSDALRTSISRACKAAGVPVFSPHDLRHRRISLLHLRGVPWARIGEFVGQRSLSVTANTYSHVLVDESEVDYRDLLEL